MNKISAFVITCDKKPEEVLFAVVKRVVWADEIIIVDKGRIGLGTWDVEVGIERFSPRLKLVRIPWSPVYEADRLIALSRCTHDWIVAVDDDEILSPDCERIFRDFVERNKHDILEIPIRNYVLGQFDRNALYWPEWRPTLHRRGTIQYGSTLHHGIGIVENARIQKLHEEAPAYIDHLSHANVSQWFEKTNRYTDYPDRTSAGRIETDYISAVAWLRKEYDMIDAIKRWEAENLPDGTEEFRKIAQRVLDNG